MCDGKVAFSGTDSKGNTICSIEFTDSALNATFYIRYIHGVYTPKVGDVLKRGEQIGLTDTIGDSSGIHLHLDFSLSPNNDNPVKGQIDGNNFIYNGQSFPIYQGVDLNKVKSWYNMNGMGGNQYGYCWLTMASELLIFNNGEDDSEKTFVKTFSRGTYYSYEKENVPGGSGRKLIDCSIGEGDIKGSIASSFLHQKYTYNYNKKRTTLYLEIPDYPEMNGKYYLDDSDAGNPNVIDFFYNYSSNCPFKQQGVVEVKCWIIK